MNKLHKLWINLKLSFWFIPALILITLIVLAIALIRLDTHIDSMSLIEKHTILLFAGPDGSRTMLSVISSSMITVASLIFSITILALSQASMQFSPRVLYHFMGNRITQIVLGMSAGIFTYCLLILRVLHSGDVPPIHAFIPTFSILTGFILALVGVGLLIYFIHYIAYLLQPSSIIEDLSNETLRVINNLYPKQLTNQQNNRTIELEKLNQQQNWQPIPSEKTGYLQNIFFHSMAKFAKNHQAVIRMEHEIGAFIIEGAPLATILMSDKPTEKMIHQINQHVTMRPYRRIIHDISFGIQQLVDITLKASTGENNDVTTAVGCINYLGAIMACLAVRQVEPMDIYPENNKPYIILLNPSFEKLLDIAFNQIRQCTQGNTTIIIRLLNALKNIALVTQDEQRKKAIFSHVELIADNAKQTIHCDIDQKKIQTHAESLKKLLNKK